MREVAEMLHTRFITNINNIVHIIYNNYIFSTNLKKTAK